jgi:hypothetical protein
MTRRILATAIAAVAFAASMSAQPSKTAGKGSAKPPAPAAKAGTTVDAAAVSAYAAKFLSFDPESKVTAEKAPDRISGMQGWKVHRKGRYEKLNVDKVFYVSDDGKWFFGGDPPLVNPNPRPVRTVADLGWLEQKFGEIFRTTVHVQMVPERDAGSYKAVATAVETGYGPVRMPGRSGAGGSICRRIARPGLRARRSTSSSTPTWNADTARCAACKWTGCSRRTPGSSTRGGTTSSFPYGSATFGR